MRKPSHYGLLHTTIFRFIRFFSHIMYLCYVIAFWDEVNPNYNTSVLFWMPLLEEEASKMLLASFIPEAIQCFKKVERLKHALKNSHACWRFSKRVVSSPSAVLRDETLSLFSQAVPASIFLAFVFSLMLAGIKMGKQIHRSKERSVLCLSWNYPYRRNHEHYSSYTIADLVSPIFTK